MSDWLGSRHVKSDVTRVMYPNVFASLGSAQVHIPLVLLKISINSSSDKWNSLWMIPALDPIIWTFNNNLYSSLDWWIWPVTLKHWDVLRCADLVTFNITKCETKNLGNVPSEPDTSHNAQFKLVWTLNRTWSLFSDQKEEKISHQFVFSFIDRS